jgi:hypothetical protein
MGWNENFVFAFARKFFQNNFNCFGINFWENGNLAKTVETFAKTENIWKCFANIVNFANLFLTTSLRKQTLANFCQYYTSPRLFPIRESHFRINPNKVWFWVKGRVGGPPRTVCRCLHSHLNEYQLVNMVAKTGMTVYCISRVSRMGISRPKPLL